MLSVEFWVRPLQLGSTAYVLSKQGSYAVALSSIGNGQGITVQMTLSGGTTTLYVANALRYNIWSHLALTYDGATIKAYVNGQVSAQLAAPGSVVPSNSPILLGAGGFNGIVDDMNVYPRVLTGAEVLSHYQAAPTMTPNQPLTPVPQLSGQTTGQLNIPYGFQFAAWALDGSPVKYRIDCDLTPLNSTIG